MKVKIHTLCIRHEDSEPSCWVFETLDALTEFLRNDLMNEYHDDRYDLSDGDKEDMPNWDHDQVLREWRNHFDCADIEIDEATLDFLKMDIVKEQDDAEAA